MEAAKPKLPSLASLLIRIVIIPYHIWKRGRTFLIVVYRNKNPSAYVGTGEGQKQKRLLFTYHDDDVDDDGNIPDWEMNKEFGWTRTHNESCTETTAIIDHRQRPSKEWITPQNFKKNWSWRSGLFSITPVL